MGRHETDAEYIARYRAGVPFDYGRNGENTPLGRVRQNQLLRAENRELREILSWLVQETAPADVRENAKERAYALGVTRPKEST